MLNGYVKWLYVKYNNTMLIFFLYTINAKINANLEIIWNKFCKTIFSDKIKLEKYYQRSVVTVTLIVE